MTDKDYNTRPMSAVSFKMPADEYSEFRKLAREEYTSCSRFALRAVRAAMQDVKRRRAQRVKRRKAKEQADVPVATTEGAQQ